MKLEYRIMGIPQRLENIEKLKSELDLSSSDVFIDFECKKNPMWTWKQTITLPRKEDTTHIVMVQDDAILCNDFKKFCEYIVNRFPDEIISPFNLKNDVKHTLPMHTIYQDGRCVGGVCMIIPCKYINDIITFQEKEYYDDPVDDRIITIWGHRHNVKVLTTFPSVVSTFENNSALEHDYKSPFYFEPNPCDFKWKNATPTKLYNIYLT